MNHSILVKLQKDQIAVGSLIEKLIKLSEREGEVGAIATFIGRVRGKEDTRKVDELFLEHYPTMTEKKLRKLFAMLVISFQLTAASLSIG